MSWAPVDPERLFEVALVQDAGRGALGVAAVRVLAGDGRARPWMALTIENRPLAGTAARFAAALGIEGPLHLLFQEAEGVYRVLDVQAGFPMWIEVVRKGGPNLVEMAVRQALGEPFEGPGGGGLPATPAGILFSQTAEDIVIDPAHPASKGVFGLCENHD
ncbi:MAG: hypothetical protein V2A76_17690 [Planctomycetota bacterium]